MNRPSDAPGGALDAGTLEAVSTLTLKVRRVVEGLLGGDHASMHRGASVEFAEHKKYSPGDDIRQIDWRAYARTDRYFVKTHEREVTMRCLMILDCSPSMGYVGSRAASSKLDFSRVLMAAMAHVLVRQGDAVGMLPFAAGPMEYLPPDRRPEHLPLLMKRLAALTTATEGSTGFVEAIRTAAERAGRRAMVAIASDLLTAGVDTEIALASLAARGHDVVIFHVLSPDEIDLPFERSTEFVGLEGDGEVTVDPALVREDYRRAIEAERERWRAVTGKAGIDMVSVVTSETPASVLSGFASRRHRLGRIR